MRRVLKCRCADSPAELIQPCFGEAFLQITGEEGLEDLLDAAFHELIQVVECQFDAVIGDAVLRIVVGADFFLRDPRCR